MTRDHYDSEQYRRTAQRQIKVGILADRDYTARQIATEIGCAVNTVYNDLAAMDMRARPERGPAVCGTTGGYQAHRRRHETPCQPCKTAASSADRRRKAARAAKEATTQ
ncbi:hypothetical protein [uncultured Gordonia sp.]|uniref:hypothetical protein n=1 Tax=uncultured Gordonia sp. TaxID=198437 RepID=UPI002588B992|nr:hypothetical protein [uncultured Gordonia sp.]